jgi:DNA-binding transcriptional LysR family regulator
MTGQQLQQAGPEFRELRYFIAVAEQLHFGRAAKDLHISQPPLSQAIAKLERLVGVRLLERTSRHVELTEPGAAFLEEARMLIETLDGAIARTRAISRGEAGCLMLGTTPATRYSTTPSTLRMLTSRSPHLHVELVEGTAAFLLDALKRATLDVVIAYEIRPQPWLIAETIRAEEIVAAVGLRNPLAGRSLVTLDELISQPFVIGFEAADPDIHAAQLEIFRSHALDPELVREAPADADWDGELAASGFSLATLQVPPHGSVRLVPIEGGREHFRLRAAWRRGGRRPAVDRLLTALRDLNGPELTGPQVRAVPA